MRIALTFLALISSLVLSAQSAVDVLKLQIGSTPDIVYRSDSLIKEETSWNALSLKAFVPLEIDSGAYMLVGAGLKRFSVVDQNLQEAQARLGISSRLNRDTLHTLKGTLIYIPSFRGDRGALNSGDLQSAVYAVLSRKMTERLELSIGGYYSAELFGPLLVPIIGMRWHLSPSLWVEANLPVSLAVRKSLGREVNLGLRYSGLQSSYKLSDTGAYLHASENTIDFFSELYITKHLLLRLEAGHSVLRDYLIYGQGDQLGLSLGPIDLGDERQALSPSLGQSIIVKGGLYLRLGQ